MSGDLFDNGFPVSRLVLPEKAGGRIPGGVVPGRPQRQSGHSGRRTQVGLPREAERCAIAVSALMTRSMDANARAVSMKSEKAAPG